jgi:hypothetical protein
VWELSVAVRRELVDGVWAPQRFSRIVDVGVELPVALVCFSIELVGLDIRRGLNTAREHADVVGVDEFP